MKNIGTFLFTFLAATLFCQLTVFAYFDPGTGSMLLQVLAGSALLIGVGWRFIVSFFKKIFKKKDGGK